MIVKAKEVDVKQMTFEKVARLESNLEKVSVAN
jgi:hypothetical protein